MVPRVALSAAFFLSGAAGLVFQIVWLYRCGLVLGSSVAAVTVVLSGFMGGLAAGNALAAIYAARVRRLLLVYGLLELTVAAVGLLVTYILSDVGPILVPIAGVGIETGISINVARFVLAFALLVVPATAMGATLPVLVAALCRGGDRFGSALGRLYGWNTLGAVAGVVGCEVVLIAQVGVVGSAWTAALLNVCAAALALAVGDREGAPAGGEAYGVRAVGRTVDAIRSGGSSDPPANAPPGAAGPQGKWAQWPLYSATSLSGALLLALEVAWFRLLSMYVLVTTLAMSLMLAVVLAGIGAGGLLGSAWLRRRAHASRALPVIACASGLATIGSYIAFQSVTTGTQAGEWHTVLWFAAILTLPVSCLSGVLFTLIGDAVHKRGASAAASAGWLTLTNTAGAIAGPPVTTYLLLPHVGLERTVFVVALGYGAVAMLAAANALAGRTPGAHGRTHRTPSLVAAAMLVVALAAFPFGTMGSRYFLRAAAAYGDDGATIVATREGPSETLFVMQQQWLGKPVYSRLVTNGFSMSGTALQGQRYMRAFAYYPMLLHDGPLKRALVICYGVGVTVGAVTHIPSIESIDVAEISRDVVAMSDAIYPPGARPLDDPRVRLHIEDGRFFLQATRERFDLITGEPPPPRTPGTVNIYTREYFQLVHDRLTDGGIATYWVPVARPHPGTDVNTIVRAFCEVFSDCSLWNATPFDLMLVGSHGMTGPRAAEQFSAPWQTPGLEARLREVGFERPEQIGATFIGDAAFLKELTASTPPLTDDFPQRLRPVAGRPSLSDPAYGTDAAVTHMYQSTIDPARARAAFVSSPLIRQIWPASLIQRTLPYFEQQAILNRVYWEGGQPLRQIEALDAVLTTTSLRTLPLWILGSDEVKQQIAESGSDSTGAAEYARALRALSGRDFAGAAQLLAAAQRRGLSTPTVRPLIAYALLRSGQADAARQLADVSHPASDDEQHFWDWLARQLRVSAPPRE